MKEAPFALRNEQGQGTLEWFIAFPVVMLLLGGIVQTALVFTTQSTLNWATFYGVREATIHHGSVQALRTGLAKGLMPLYPGGKNPGAAQTATAYAAAVSAVDNPGQAAEYPGAGLPDSAHRPAHRTDPATGIRRGIEWLSDIAYCIGHLTHGIHK